MAHFAHVVDGFVLKVHVVNNDVIIDKNGQEQESLGKDFLANLYGYNKDQIFQCSYNGNIRGAYPSAGWLYNSELDIFIPPVIEPVEEGN